MILHVKTDDEENYYDIPMEKIAKIMGIQITEFEKAVREVLK